MLDSSDSPDRRRFMQYFASLGLGATALPSLLWAEAAGGAEITTASIAAAEEMAGLRFADEQRTMMLEGIKAQQRQIDELHAVKLDNGVAPALRFDVRVPGTPAVGPRGPKRAAVTSPVVTRVVPAADRLAFLGVAELGALVRRRQVTATQLTRLYLDRIGRIDPRLKSVITVTEARAVAQARQLDEQQSAGRYRGPLHGIPWGAKDLLATKGYKTTWGAGPYKDQVIDEDAEVVRRLDAAGAVLVAKLTLGELAQGDVWFGNGPTDRGPTETTRTGWRTRNPWNLDQGSSGSSAGPAAATAAGLVAFAIGSETLGSISSPSTRCGTTGLRPTFGRVPRTGAMALSWTMDKLGPICRSAEDCALVLDAIRGPDGKDLTVEDAPYHYDARMPLRGFRLGYVKSAFDLPEVDPQNAQRRPHPTKKWDDAALEVLRGLGVTMVPVELPEGAWGAMRLILVAEAAAAFDELTRSGRDRELVQQGPNDWANTFRTARFIPAADYINANRARTLAMQRWHALMQTVDAIVTPTSAAGLTQLVATNFTGHPAVILPHGFRDDGTPVSLTFLGRLWDEGRLCALANAYQRKTDFHRRIPTLA